MRTYRRRPFLFDRHMRRLRRSASMMHLDVPFTDDDLLRGSRRRWARPLWARPRPTSACWSPEAWAT
jgi:branched-subunit amino acid aminotransferase/4-amino-4-deoxychorismate lyase